VIAASSATPRIHGLSLAIALVIMIAGTLYPPLMTDAAGHADHLLAGLLFWAMSAGFVRGVGFVPHHVVARWPLSATACLLATGGFVALRLMR
jgi:predicted membrane protein